MLNWKRTSNRYGETPEPATPYQAAQQAWDNRLGSARVQAKNWRIMALAESAIILLLAGGLIWTSSRSYVTPYVVELSTDGAVRAVAPATESYNPSDAQIAYHLAEFIKNARGVSIDPIVVRQNWLKAYDYATDVAATSLNDYARDNDPFADVGSRSVSVHIDNIVRASGDSFTIRWRETAYRNGAKLTETKWTATLSIVHAVPRDADTLHRNPLGLYVHGINWSRDLTSRGN